MASTLSCRRLVRQPLTPAALAFAFGWPAACHAQAVPDTHVEQTLQTVTVKGLADPGPLEQPSGTGSRLRLSARQTPASVESIAQEVIEQRGARTLEEALRGATGLVVGGNPSSPGVASTRGFTGGFVSYLFDGVRVSTPTMSNRPQDSWNYERIEVLKGPASVLYGEGAIGAVVNFVPKQPNRDAPGTQALLSYGNPHGLRAGVGLGRAVGDSGAWRLDFSHNRTDGWADRNEQQSDHLTGAVRLAFAPAITLDLALDYLRDDIQPHYGTPLVPAAFAAEPTDVVSDSAGRVIDRRLARTNYNVADGLMESESLGLRAKLGWQIVPQWQLRNELAAYTADRHWRNAESLNFVAPDRMNRDQVDVTHDHQVITDRLDLSHQGTLGEMKNRFVAGMELNRTDFASQRRFSDGSASTNAALQVAAVNPAVGVFNDSPALTTGAGNRTDVSADVTTTALFAEDALSLTDALTLVAGLRTERIQLARNVIDLNTATSTAFGTTYKPSSSRVGVVYDVSRTTSLYAQAVNAAAPVGTSNLLLQSAANTSFPLTRGKQVEIGVKQSLPQQRLDWTLALYKIEQSNVLSRDPANPLVTVNNGQISSQGIELAAAWRATSGFTLSGNVALLDAQFDTLVEAGGASRVGNLPPNVPRKTGNVWADYRFADLPLTVGAAVRGVGGMYTNNANTVRINGYWLGDVYASWHAAPAVLTLRVRNVTDEMYATWAGANANNQVILGAPRTVELSARFDF
jgi:iron complex outermembrane recepter protein